MASYVETTLSAGERIEYQAKISLWSLLPLMLLGLVLIGVMGLGLIFWVAAFLRYFSTELAITNKRVVAKTGFISRKTVEINLNKIESVRVDQGVLGRIFNFGTVVVAGAGNPHAPIAGISDPIRFRNAFTATQEGSSTAAHVLPA